MASIQATRLRKGNLIKVGDDLLRILDLHHLTPGNKRGFVQCRARNIRSSTLVDYKFRAEEDIERAILDEHDMQYLYSDGDAFHFMNTETFEQLHIDREVLGDAVNYILPDSTIKVEFYGTEPVGIDLPVTVDLRVEDTVPGIKGATASAQVKPARTETGLVVQVPPFINIGDRIRVNTETGRISISCLSRRLQPEPQSLAMHMDVPAQKSNPTAGSKSSPAACSAARAKSSSAACGARRSRGRRCRFSSRRSTTGLPRQRSSRTARCAFRASTSAARPSCCASINDDTEVVGIDEAQFFDKDLPAACTRSPAPASAWSWPGSTPITSAGRSSRCRC